MDTCYEVFLDGTVVGTARVSRCGLYYHIFCRCSLPKGEYMRLNVHGANGEYCLGTCVWEHGAYEVNTRVAVRHLGDSRLQFYLKRGDNSLRFVPIEVGEPFEYLHILRFQKLSYQGDIPGIFTDQE